jgi:hypothetical protein
MREAKLKLNPEKCVSRVMWGKVLGCLVSTMGIKASLDKIKINPPNAASANKKNGAKVNRPHNSLE